MNLVKLENLQLHYGEQVIFDQLGLLLKRGDRLCIVGRNGVGKSTLMKVIAGEVEPDSGNLWTESGTHIASLTQELPEASDICVFDYVANGLPQLGRDLARFAELVRGTENQDLAELGKIQQRIEAADGWSVQNRIEQTLTRLQLDGEVRLQSLSGGWRRRAALARALVSQPDVLLLDEPTNHLDIPSIEWLEQQLLEFSGAVLFVTHDRAFLQKVANKIGELDRGQLTVWDGDYQGFLGLRERQLAEEEKQNAVFDKRLAQEEVWIRQGIKARRTRNEGRVRALEKMRAERAARLGRLGTVSMAVSTESTSGKLVAEFNNVSFAWGDKRLIENFSGTIMRGDKIGLLGPNGIGKSTFLKLLMGELEPTSGTIRLGSKLETAYFDQLREQLDLDKNAVDNVAQGREFIEIGGRSRHIISYLQDFLFTGERARTPLRALSGGERNRLLLAKLFSKPANLLIMDEPTNDLDAETLELLEERLTEYSGTLLLVSHDRAFLNNVVSSTIGFEGDGKLREYVGGYEDWVRQGGVWPQQLSSDSDLKAEKPAARDKPMEHQKVEAKKVGKKLSYKLQLELDELPQKIDLLEGEVNRLHQKVSEPSFYEQPQDKIAQTNVFLADQEAQLEQLYNRWQELELMKEGG